MFPKVSVQITVVKEDYTYYTLVFVLQIIVGNVFVIDVVSRVFYFYVHEPLLESKRRL